MKILKLLLIVACTMLLVTFFGCRTKQIATIQKVDSIVYSERLVTKYDTIITPADSASIKAYFECDSLGNVLIRELNEEKGKLKVRTIFKNNTIEILVNVDSAAIIRQAEEQFKSRYDLNKIGTSVIQKKSCDWFRIFAIGFGVGFSFYFLIGKLRLF